MRTTPSPILAAPLIRQVDQSLLALLRSLTPSEWSLPVIVPSWTVRDVAAHLLDTATRKLSLARDGCFVEQVSINSPDELVAFVNRLNHEGVAVYRRLSPPLLIEWMESVCTQFAGFHEALDPFAPSLFPVSWAGESTSLNWFDTARELTERWHHQQQIRLAVGRPGILTPELYHPVLDCFVRGLPHHLHRHLRPHGAALVLVISGASGGQWTLQSADDRWELLLGPHPSPLARVTIPEEIAWRVFTKGISPDAARQLCACEGDPELCDAVLTLRAIVG